MIASNEDYLTMRPNTTRTGVTPRSAVHFHLRLPMKLRLLPLIAVFAASGNAAAEDGFNGIRCGADIAKALAGRHMPNERVAAMEARHKDLGLKDLGASELTWGTEIWWQICGARYVLLEDNRSIVRDALKLPAQPGITTAFEGACKGPQGEQEVIAVLESQAGAAYLPAKAAWKIDDSKKSFVRVPVDGLLCPRDGIVDGGP